MIFVYLQNENTERWYSKNEWGNQNYYGDCEGVVEDRMFPNLTAKQAPELNVRWFPSMLRYGYDPSELVVIKTIKDFRKEKLNKINQL